MVVTKGNHILKLVAINSHNQKTSAKSRNPTIKTVRSKPFWGLAGLPPAILDGLVGRQLSETFLFVEQFCNRWEVQFGPTNQRKKTTQ